MITIVFSLISCLHSTRSASVSYAEETRAMVYMMQYGYVEPDQWKSSLTTEEEYRKTVSKVVRDFQAFANIDITGSLDAETLELMEMPRCGVKDQIGEGSRARRRRKRFVLQGSRWKETNLTYRISRYPGQTSLTKADVDLTLSQAFSLWAEASGLEFRASLASKVDIEISFASYQHGDGDPFDGQGQWEEEGGRRRWRGL